MGEPRNANEDFDSDAFLLEVKVFMLRNGLPNSYLREVLETSMNPNSYAHTRILNGTRPLSLRDACRLARMADISLDRFLL